MQGHFGETQLNVLGIITSTMSGQEKMFTREMFTLLT
jgi:hypothetical protein